MIERSDVRSAVERMVVVWPVLGKRDDLRQEIGRAVMENAHRLDPRDVERGVNLLVRTCKTAASDGGPAWPPGPNEVLGCVLAARGERLSQDPKDHGQRVTGPQRVEGRMCGRCLTGMVYLAPERVMMCPTCKSVHVWEWMDGNPRIHARPDEIATLTLETDEPVMGTPEDARLVVRRLAQKFDPPAMALAG